MRMDENLGRRSHAGSANDRGNLHHRCSSPQGQTCTFAIIACFYSLLRTIQQRKDKSVPTSSAPPYRSYPPIPSREVRRRASEPRSRSAAQDRDGRVRAAILVRTGKEVAKAAAQDRRGNRGDDPTAGRISAVRGRGSGL